MVFANFLFGAVVMFGIAPCDAQCEVVPVAEGEFTKEPYLGKRPPELVSTDGRWWNTEGPLTLESLRGEPVLLVYTALW